jgi:hypothetical protein
VYCLMVADLLTLLEGEYPPDHEAMAELAAAGLVSEAASAGGGSSDRARDELRELQEKRAGLRMLAASANDAEIAQLERDAAAVDARIREVRSSLLAAKAGPRKWTLTFRGRDLLGEITSRRDRLAGVTIATFRAEMDRLRTTTAIVTAKAARILAIIAPKALALDEIHCRSAAVGLALDPRTAEDLAQRWLNAVSGLDPAIAAQDRGPVAEHLVLSQNDVPAAFVALVRQLRVDCKDDADAVDCATLAWSVPADKRDDQHKLAVRAGVTGQPLAPYWLIRETMPADFDALVLAVGAVAGTTDGARIAAAFLHLSGVDREVAIARYRTTLSWLSGLSDQGIPVLAGMLGLVNAEPAGVLDDLRLVCAEISKAKLAVDGAENLGLGVKLLLGLGRGGGWLLVGSGASTPLSAALSPLIATPTIAVPAVSTFHRSSIVRPMFRASHRHSFYG